MRSWRAAVPLVAFAMASAISTGVGSATSPPTSEPVAAQTSAEETLPPTETATTDSEWETVVPGGDCACADGSEFNFWTRQADPTKVVLFLEGGGACFDATTCAFTADSTTYDWNISPDDDPALMSGIFDFANPENPFADYSFVYVPYCTGDVHLGNLRTSTRRS